MNSDLDENMISTPRQRLLEAQRLDSLVEPQIDHDETEKPSCSSVSEEEISSGYLKKRPQHDNNIEPLVLSTISYDELYNFDDKMEDFPVRIKIRFPFIPLFSSHSPTYLYHRPFHSHINLCYTFNLILGIMDILFE